MTAVILAAGRGSRLLPYSNVLPKPLMPIEKSEREEKKSFNQKERLVSIVEKLIGQLIVAEVENIVMVVGHLGESVMRYLGDGSRFGVNITYVFQEKLDGNGGAFYCTKHLWGEADVVVLDCDNFFESKSIFLELKKAFYQKQKETGIEMMVLVAKVSSVEKFAIIHTNEEKIPLKIIEKPKTDRWGCLAKSGVMMLKNSFLALPKEISKTTEGEYTTTQMIQYAIENKIPLELFEVSALKDIGTWEEYLSVLNKNLGV